ncbi:MAG TPA: NAD+ synthase [Dehalococcoidia bacterium]|nr:NAD+ synthase [Dehalococcoidia bacterium]
MTAPAPLRVVLGQINMVVGDIEGNARRILQTVERARELEADVVALHELAVTGYPPEDLLLRRAFIDENLAATREIARACTGLFAIIGFVDARDDIYNAAAVVHDGAIVDVYHKRYLPNYGVFDENRYFQAGDRNPVYEMNGVTIGISICEDIWYPGDPIRAQALAGAEVVVNINGSPYHMRKVTGRERMLATRAADHTVSICYVNTVGGQDELVFDGGSMVLNERGERIAMAKQFEEDLLACDVDVQAVRQYRLHDPRRRKERAEIRPEDIAERIIIDGHASRSERSGLPPYDVPPLGEDAEAYHALVLGTRDYVRKCGFQDVLVGLSGGIDSSLVATIASDALGPSHVYGVSMPSRYSSEGSITDAKELAENLGIHFTIIPIEDTFVAMLETLAPTFANTVPGLAEENLQARIRGNLIMAISNKFNRLVLTTGNKSEMATGYATIYGDMAGGFAVLKDVPKTLVYRLAEWRNAQGDTAPIPQNVLTKAPSAELRPGQTDQDSLPPYAVLDPILQAYVEDDRSLEEIVRMGFDEATVRRVIRLVTVSEYKRRQAPPGVKITPRAFGRDRRLPIANAYGG